MSVTGLHPQHCRVNPLSQPFARDIRLKLGGERVGQQLVLFLELTHSSCTCRTRSQMERCTLHHCAGKLTVEIALQRPFVQALFHRLPPIFPYTLANSLRPRATRLPTLVSLSDKVVAISR